MQNFKTEVGFPLTTAKSAHETEGLMTDKLLSYFQQIKFQIIILAFMPITTRNVKLQIQIWVYMQSRQRIHHRHEEHQLSCLPRLAVNADLFPVVARHGNAVTFGTEAEKSDKRKYVFVFKITNGVVCVQPLSPPVSSGKETGRLYTSYIGERNQDEKVIFLQVMENLPTYWNEVKRKSNKTKH